MSSSSRKEDKKLSLSSFDFFSLRSFWPPGVFDFDATSFFFAADSADLLIADPAGVDAEAVTVVCLVTFGMALLAGVFWNGAF